MQVLFLAGFSGSDPLSRPWRSVLLRSAGTSQLLSSVVKLTTNPITPVTRFPTRDVRTGGCDDSY
jgi:hypothetical protein